MIHCGWSRHPRPAHWSITQIWGRAIARLPSLSSSYCQGQRDREGPLRLQDGNIVDFDPAPNHASAPPMMWHSSRLRCLTLFVRKSFFAPAALKSLMEKARRKPKKTKLLIWHFLDNEECSLLLMSSREPLQCGDRFNDLHYLPAWWFWA